MVAVTARTRRVIVLDGEVLAAGWKSSCHSQPAADVLRKEHADLGTAALFGCGGDGDRRGGVCGGLEKRGEACREGGGLGASDLFGPSPLDTVLVRPTAEEMGLGIGGRRRRVARKQTQRLAVRTRKIVMGDEESATSPAFPAVSERQDNTVFLFAAGKRQQGASLRVMPGRSSSLDAASETVPLFVVCFSRQLLSTREPSQPHEELDQRAPLFVATGSVCQKAGWLLSVDRQMRTTTRPKHPFQFIVPEKAVVLAGELLVMHASRSLSARARADSGPC